jgi:hypothetical protein
MTDIDTNWDDTATGTIGITAGMEWPYYDALSSGLINDDPNVVGISGRAFLIDNTNGRWNRKSVKVVEQRNVSSQRDLILLPQGVWRQTVSSWHKGAGQSNMDREDSDIDRYYKSINIDFTTKWQASLLNQTQEMLDLGEADDAPMYMKEINGALFAACGTKVIMITDWDTNSAWTYEEHTLADTATGMTTDGEYAIVSHGTSITRFENNTGSLVVVDTFAPSTGGPCDFVLYTQDRLVTNSGNELWDVTPGASEELIYTHPIPTFKWVAGTGAPNGTYLVGGTGDKWMVQYMQLNDTGASFDPPIVANSLPEGEIGYSIVAYQGFIVVGTRWGFRMMEPNATGLLNSGAGVPTGSPVWDFEPQNRFIWYTQSYIADGYEPTVNQDTVQQMMPPPGVMGLGRMDLAEYTDVALTPAYANDLIAQEKEFVWPKAEMTLLNGVGAITCVASVAAIDVSAPGITGQRVFGRAGGKIYSEVVGTPAPGWLEQGRMSYSVEDQKAGLYQIVKWYNPNDGGIYLDYRADGTGWYRSARVNMSTGISSGHRTTEGLLFSRLEPRYVIIPGTMDASITRWELRSVPTVGQASAWEVPVMNYQELDINGSKVIRNPTDELEFLMNLVQSGRLFFYQESGNVYTVHATGFEWQPETLATGGLGWQGTYVLKIEEIS